jgi:hypothetical protein
MKHPPGKLSFLAVLLYLTACTKTQAPSNDFGQAGLSGKWDLITDSTFEGVGSTNHPVDYMGEAGDYFNFGANGHAYTKEGNVLDTLTYTLASDTSLVISDFGGIFNGIPDTSSIKALTANNSLGLAAHIIVIESPRFLTPGGEFWRKMTLSR